MRGFVHQARARGGFFPGGVCFLLRVPFLCRTSFRDENLPVPLRNLRRIVQKTEGGGFPAETSSVGIRAPTDLRQGVHHAPRAKLGKFPVTVGTHETYKLRVGADTQPGYKDVVRLAPVAVALIK